MKKEEESGDKEKAGLRQRLVFWGLRVGKTTYEIIHEASMLSVKKTKKTIIFLNHNKYSAFMLNGYNMKYDNHGLLWSTISPFKPYSMGNDHVTPRISGNDIQIDSAYHTQNVFRWYAKKKNSVGGCEAKFIIFL